MKRREFIKLGIAASLLAGCDRIGPDDKIGLALGAGGARGLAHIPMLEVLDELGLRPHRIAGSSIGAVMGVLFAAGMPGREIRKLVGQLTISDDESWLASLFENDVERWWNLLNLRLGRGGLLDTGAFIGFIEKATGVTGFDQLAIPLKLVASDLWRREQVVFETGALGPALQASIAIPGLFTPVEHRGRVLVDGGLVNPVPYDLLFDDCDQVIAIDVGGVRSPSSGDEPGYFETLFSTMQVMQASIMQAKMEQRPPDVYIRPEIENIRVLDFNRVNEIYAQSESARTKLKKALR